MSWRTDIINQFSAWELDLFLRLGGTLPHGFEDRHRRLAEGEQLRRETAERRIEPAGMLQKAE